jgi:tRNA A-37 threonylcarbamoyl transferase component Bud32
MPPERPSFIARYEVQARLGQGAMGIVYRARDPQLDRIVAIKTVRSDLGLASDDLAVYRQRFFQEAKAAGRLNHPNVVAMYDVMEVEQTPYIVMEYVQSETLATLIKAHGALPPDRALEIVRQVCLALEHAHTHGVVHRDIKPANILFGNTGEVKVADFGIARIEGQDLTLTGACLGTPSYMSPEQIRGRAVDGRSDLFSLGAVLYEALSGERPFPGQDAIAVIHSIVHDEPAPLHERNPRVHPALSAAVGRALAKDRKQRYPTARAFADALGAAAAASRPDAPAVAPRRGWAAGPLMTRRRRLALIGVCGVVVATAAGLAAWRHLAPARTAEVRVAPALPAASETSRPARGLATEPRGGADSSMLVPKAPAESVRPDAPPSVVESTPAPPVDTPARVPRTSGDERVPRDARDKRTAAAAPRAADPPPSPLASAAPPPLDARPLVTPPSPGRAASADSGRGAPPSHGMARPPADPRPEAQRHYAFKQERSDLERPASFRPPPTPDTPAPSLPPLPAATRGEVAGRWQGRYQCQREEIGFLLNITSRDGARIAAVFEFFPLPGTLSFPRGSFNMSGEYDPRDGSIRLHSAGWIERPLGFQSHDIEGRLDSNGHTISGRVLTTGCAHFVLARR